MHGELKFHHRGESGDAPPETNSRNGCSCTQPHSSLSLTAALYLLGVVASDVEGGIAVVTDKLLVLLQLEVLDLKFEAIVVVVVSQTRTNKDSMIGPHANVAAAILTDGNSAYSQPIGWYSPEHQLIFGKSNF